MKKIYMVLAVLTIVVATAQARVIKAKDSYSGGSRHSNDYLISTIEASSEASFQMSVAISLEISSRVSTEAISGKSPNSGDSATLSFLDSNSLEIKKNISRGDGEHLVTLLTIMELRSDSKALSRIQLKSGELIVLNGSRLLERLKVINIS